MLDQQSKSLVRGPRQSLRTAPKHAVMDNQKVGLFTDRLLDDSARNVNCSRDTPNGAAMRELYAVQCSGIIRKRIGTEQTVEMIGDGREIDHGATNAPVESTRRIDPSYMRR